VMQLSDIADMLDKFVPVPDPLNGADVLVASSNMLRAAEDLAAIASRIPLRRTIFVRHGEMMLPGHIAGLKRGKVVFHVGPEVMPCVYAAWAADETVWRWQRGRS